MCCTGQHHWSHYLSQLMMSPLLSSGQTRDTAPCGRAAPARPGSPGHCQPPARPRLLAETALSVLTNQRSVLTNQRQAFHLEQTVWGVGSAQGRPRPHLARPECPQLPPGLPLPSLPLLAEAGSLLRKPVLRQLGLQTHWRLPRPGEVGEVLRDTDPLGQPRPPGLLWAWRALAILALQLSSLLANLANKMLM